MNHSGRHPHPTKLEVTPGGRRGGLGVGSGDRFLPTALGRGGIQGGDPPPGLCGSGLVAPPVLLCEHRSPPPSACPFVDGQMQHLPSSRGSGTMRGSGRQGALRARAEPACATLTALSPLLSTPQKATLRQAG